MAGKSSATNKEILKVTGKILTGCLAAAAAAATAAGFIMLKEWGERWGGRAESSNYIPWSLDNLTGWCSDPVKRITNTPNTPTLKTPQTRHDKSNWTEFWSSPAQTRDWAAFLVLKTSSGTMKKWWGVGSVNTGASLGGPDCGHVESGLEVQWFLDLTPCGVTTHHSPLTNTRPETSCAAANIFLFNELPL